MPAPTFFLNRLLTPNTRISALQVIVLAALALAGCGSPRTTVDRNASLDKAIVHYIDGDLQRAEALLTRITGEGGADEEVAEAYLYLGRIYLSRGDYEKAADAFSAGSALGDDFRFAEYFAEAQRHLTISPARIAQLPSVTRGQLAEMIVRKFGARLAEGSMAGEADGIDAVVRAGVMPMLPDGEFHAGEKLTGWAFYAVVRRLAESVGAPGGAASALFPGGLRGAEAGGGLVTGREVQRILDALADTVGPRDE